MVEFQDYYKTLEIERGASADEIQKAFRKLARKYHPDVSKDTDAENKFKKLNEAYEVLKDPEKRKSYDALGKNWKNGQQFQPPPNWEEVFGGAFGGMSGSGMSGQARGAGSQAGFSDFFDALFGGAAGGLDPSMFQSRPMDRPGETLEASMQISLYDAFRGSERHLTLNVKDPATGKVNKKSYKVKIPPGTTNASVIRLAGQGGPGFGNGKPGDLRLRVEVMSHPMFRLHGHDIEQTLAITPWEAALGGKIPVATLDGELSLTIPEGSQSGQRLRLRQKGMPKKGASSNSGQSDEALNGDMFVVLKIVVPQELSSEERSLLEQLAEKSNFNPRN